MQILAMIKLCLIFFISQQVSSLLNSYLEENTFSKLNLENILEKFFIDLNKVYLEKFKPRHVTVVGASTNEIQQTQTLFENYPCIICKEIERCEYSQQFSQGNFVVVFLKDLSIETFGKNINILSRCRKCRVLFVSNGMIKFQEILVIFSMAIQHVPYSEFAHLRKNVIELYSDFVATNCSTEIRLINVWKPDKFGLDNIKIWTTRSRDMNGCPVTISSLTFTPKMMIKENENGSLTIVGGREGKLVLALANKLNFTVSLRYPSMEDQLKYSRKEAILNDVASGISEIGIGRLRPINNPNSLILFSYWYDEECVTFGVPRIMNYSNDIIWVEFSWEVWASITLVFGISCAIGYTHRNIVASRNDKTKNLGFIVIFLEAITIHLGNPVVYVTTSAGGRFLLLSYLYYAMVITTAYKTSLASILTTDKGTSAIVDAQGIIEANLKVGGSSYDYNILEDQINDSKLTQDLLERFVINNNDSITWGQLMFDHDYAYLARRSSLDYDRQMILKTQESVTYDVLNNCVLAYPTVMVFQAKSLLRKQADYIIFRLVESGILKQWDYDKIDTEKILKHRNIEKYFEDRATHKFRNIFLLYFFCIFIALVTFLLELLISRVYFMKRHYMRNYV